MDNTITLEEGFNEFLDDCMARNLRPYTIKHYKEAYKVIIRYVEPSINIKKLNSNFVKDYIINLQATNIKDQTLHTYVRDLKTILYYFMKQQYIPTFKISLPKTNNKPIETYTKEEIDKLLKKPNINKCTFAEYRNWAITNTFLSLGIRSTSLRNIKNKDVDFDNGLINIMHTKNRKALILPMTESLSKVLKQYMRVRKGDTDDYLFCTVSGKQLCKPTLYEALVGYNKDRGVTTIGIHRLRHTFAKQWVLNSGSISVLQKVLGHSNLQITENYINLLTSDIAKEMEEIDILKQFNKERKSIKMKGD